MSILDAVGVSLDTTINITEGDYDSIPITESIVSATKILNAITTNLKNEQSGGGKFLSRNTPQTITAVHTFSNGVSGVNKTHIGLSNVDNTTDANKPISTLQQNALDGLSSNINSKAPINNPSFTGVVSGISKTMVGLGSVDNTSDANKPVSTLQQAELNLKAPINNPSFTGVVSGISKAMVGLSNVTDTSDENKPISTLQQQALNAKANLSGCDFTGNVSFSSLPTSTASVVSSNELTTKNYVDNSISSLIGSSPALLNTLQEINSAINNDPNFNDTMVGQLSTKAGLSSSNTFTGNTNTFNNHLVFGSSIGDTITINGTITSNSVDITPTQLSKVQYVDVSSNISSLLDALAPKSNPTLNNATFTGSVSGIGKADVGLGNVNNTSDANKPVSDLTQAELDKKADLATGNTFTGTNNNFNNNVTLGSNTSDTLTINATSSVNGVSLSPSDLSKVQHLSNITSDVKGLIDAKTTNTAIQGNANNWTSTNNYDIMPTSSSSITLNNHLTNKEYVDNKVNSLLGTENYWTERNYFNDYLPKSTLTPSNGQHFTTKGYVDGKVSDMLTNNNSWEGLNHFNVSLPSSTQTPVNDGDLTTKIFCDETYLKLAGNADITGTKNFQNISVSGTTTLSGNVSCIANVNLGSDSGDIITITGTTSANGVSLSPSTISKVQYLSNTTSSVQDQINTKTTLSEVQGNANTFTNANTFDTTITSKEGVLFPYVSVSGSQVPQYLEWRNNAGGSNGSISSSTSDGILINTPSAKKVSFSSGDLNNIVATISPSVPIYATDVVTRQYGLRENLQFVFNYGQTFTHSNNANSHYAITPSVNCYLNFTKSSSFQTALVEITYSISVSSANAFTLSNNISYHAVYLVRTSTPVPVSGNPVTSWSINAIVMNKFSSVMPDPTTQLTFANGLTNTTYQPVRFLGTSTNGNRVQIIFGFPNIALNKSSNNAWINGTSCSARIISSAPNTTDGTMTYPNTLKSLSNMDFQQNSVGGCHITRT